MQASKESLEIASPATTHISWLMDVVMRLPPEPRSSLKIDQLSLVGFTDVRNTSYENQDRIVVAYCAEQGASPNWLLAIVCDGVGGSSHGERAASLTISQMTLEMSSLRRLNATDALREALLRAHLLTAESFQHKSSTTVAALLITEEDAAIGWVGDSRVYEISRGKASLLTNDDTLASAIAKADSVLAAELNDEYAERLSQAIGGANTVVPNVVNWRPMNDEAFCILCTDGVWKPTEPVLDSLVNRCKDAPELMRRLLIQSDWMGGLDNASAVYVPPLSVVRRFLSESANRSAPDSIVVCLPGPSQTLIPARSYHLPLNNGFAADQHKVKDVKRGISTAKKSSTKNKTDSSKRASKRDNASPNQLVIAEETPDDTSPQSPGPI